MKMRWRIRRRYKNDEKDDREETKLKMRWRIRRR